jgi:hypothetical protein
MAVYILQDGHSDFQADGVPFDYHRILGTDTVGIQDVTFTVPAATTINIYFLTPAGHPNSDAWESGGSWTAEWGVVATGAGCRTRCRVGRARIKPTLAFIQFGTFTAFQTLTSATLFTFNPVAPTWTTSAEDCANRIIIQYQIRNLSPSVSQNVTIRMGTTDAEVTTDVTESDTCRRVFIS